MSLLKQAIVQGAKALHWLTRSHLRARKNAATTDPSMETGKSLSEPYEEVPKSSDGAASSATVVVAEQDGHVPISSPQPKIDEASGNNQVVLPAGLFDQLQKATQAHIEMRDCEREADATAQHLERRLDFLDEQISTIQRDLAEARPDVMKPKSESCIDMQEGLQKCLREKEKIFGLLEKIEEYLHEDHENYRERTEGFFEMWRKIVDPGSRNLNHNGDVVLPASPISPMKKTELCRDCVQAPGSDVETVFDDVENGHLNSGVEADGATGHHDNPKVLRWLAGDEGTSNALPHEPKNLDSLSARSIEVWDSASTLAEAAHRRRIDRWAEHVQELRRQGDGARPFEIPTRTSSKGWRKKVGLAK